MLASSCSEAPKCLNCGKRLTYIMGFRGLGLRERRHARKCLASTLRVAMATNAMEALPATVKKEDTAEEENKKEIADVENTQVQSAVHVQEPESEDLTVQRCQDISTHPVDESSTSGRHFAQYYSANFRLAPASVWEQLHHQFPESAKSELVVHASKPLQRHVLEQVQDICEIEEATETDELQQLVDDIDAFIEEIEAGMQELNDEIDHFTEMEDPLTESLDYQQESSTTYALDEPGKASNDRFRSTQFDEGSMEVDENCSSQ